MTDLEKAAYDWVSAKSDYDSASVCRAPYPIIADCDRNLRQMQVELFAAAEKFYRNHYDGATE